ncbi:MAG: TRAP transporter large permease [Variibacter sp.]
MMVLLVVALLFALLAIGSPVGVAMGVAGILGLYAHGGTPVLMGILKTSSISVLSSYELMSIPMFILMAEFTLLSGIADDLFRTAAAWVGRIRGGLAMATALAGAGFAAICGSSAASAATLSATSLTAMLKQGYEARLAAGVVAISGTLAILIPPSIGLVLYGILADVSIGKLLVAGVIPGLIVTVAIMLTVAVLVHMDTARAPDSGAVAWRTKIAMLKVIGPMVILFFSVTVVIYAGIATPTEASALGAFFSFVICYWRARPSAKAIGFAVWRAARSSCMIAFIIFGAHLFGYYFTLTQTTQEIIAWVSSLPVSRWIIIAIILAGYLVLGCFMDQIAILVLTVPIVVPLIVSLGFDPIWFGIIKIVTAEVGMITPPIGLNCFIVARYADRPVAEVFRGTFPHFIAHLIVIAIFVAFPSLILWLPSRMH